MSDMPQNPIEYFRLKSSQTFSQASAGNMRRAIDSLARFAGGVDLSFSSFDTGFLAEWVASQFYEGYFAKTVAYNVSKIAALYNKAVADRLASPSDTFAAILAKVNEASFRFDGIDHSDTFRKVKAICNADYSSGSDRDLARDIIRFGLLNGGMTFMQLAAYRKDDYAGDNPHILQIVRKYSRPKNKYLFPLNQAHLTPKKLMLFMDGLTAPLLKEVGIRRQVVPNMVLADLWCDLAMNCGISASDMAACIDVANNVSALTFCATPSQLDQEQKSEYRRLVAETLTDNPLHWYAMHLRRHAEFKELTDRLAEKNITLDEIFYPMEEIYRKVGKKTVFENRPVISWLIFYRARVTQLNRLFHEVGDIAWGYRYFRDVRSPYAVIGPGEIRHYQESIGTLSPSTRLLADSEVEFSEGDYLVILGGPMNGRHGTFISEKRGKGDPSGKVVFRIKLTGGNNANWEVNWDPALVRKITADQYKELDRKFQLALNE